MKQKDDEYLGFHDKGFYYVAQGISKTKFIEMVKQHSKSGQLSANWIKERTSHGKNEKALEQLKENPGHFLILNNDNFNLIYKH